MEPLVAIARPSVSARCAFCHDALGGEWEVCAGCNTRLHPDCRANAIDCPTLGCRMSVHGRRGRPAGSWPRPAFRRALARMAARHESGGFQAVGRELDDEATADETAWPTLSLLAHAVISPCALVVFTAVFALAFVPAYWVGLVLRRGALAERIRSATRAVWSPFVYELWIAPFLALAISSVVVPLLVARAFDGAGLGNPVLFIAALVLALVVLVVPTKEW